MTHKGYSNKLVPIIFPGFVLCILALLAHKRYVMECDVWWSWFSAYISLLGAAILRGRLPFASVWFGWGSLMSCQSIKRSVKMSMQSQPTWLEQFPLAFPCCWIPLPAEGFGLMMQWVRGHYSLETCLKACCSPHFLGWQCLQHHCSLSTGKGSGWEKKSSTNWITYFKAFFTCKRFTTVKSSALSAKRQLSASSYQTRSAIIRPGDLGEGMERNMWGFKI